MTIDLIKRLVPTPNDPINSQGNWDIVYKELGLNIPQSYKLIINNYGDYYWKNFLYVLNPFSDNQNINLIKQVNTICKIEMEMRKQFPIHYPINIYPEENGILPWAITDNGDYFFWISNKEFNNWPTMIKGSRAPEFEVIFMNPILILFNILKGTFQSMILPDDI